MFRDHHGINDNGAPERGKFESHRLHHRPAAQRTRLDGVRRNVFHHRADLGRDKIRRQDLDRGDAYRVLHGKQRDRRFAVDAELVKSLEVRLNAGSPRRVRSRNRQGDGHHALTGNSFESVCASPM